MNYQLNVYRTAHSNDCETVLAIWKRCLGGEIDTSALSRFRKNFKLCEPPFGWWVATDMSEKVVAWVSILPAFSHPLKSETEAEVSLYVEPEHKSNGLGTQLLRFAFLEISSSGIERVWAFANSKNLASIKMCTNSGMVRCGETSKKTILLLENNPL